MATSELDRLRAENTHLEGELAEAKERAARVFHQHETDLLLRDAENTHLTEELSDSKAYAEELRKISVGEATHLTECRALNTRLSGAYRALWTAVMYGLNCGWEHATACGVSSIQSVLDGGECSCWRADAVRIVHESEPPASDKPANCKPETR